MPSVLPRERPWPDERSSEPGHTPSAAYPIWIDRRCRGIASLRRAGPRNTVDVLRRSMQSSSAEYAIAIFRPTGHEMSFILTCGEGRIRPREGVLILSTDRATGGNRRLASLSAAPA
jgi:hypothetical protein